MPASQLINSFIAGELSPLVGSRVDMEKYRAGCQELENFIILPSGGVIRRPGTEFLGAAKYADRAARLIGFNFSTTTSFVLEFGDGYIRFWSNEKAVKGLPTAWMTGEDYKAGDFVTAGAGDGGDAALYYLCLEEHESSTFAGDLASGKWEARSSTVIEVETPYLAAELRDLQYVQINDIMYFTHPAHMPCKLSRLADDHWTFEEVKWDWPAFLKENATETTISVGDAYPDWAASHVYHKGDLAFSGGLLYRAIKDHTSGAIFDPEKWEARAGNVEGETVDLVASDDIFETEHVGAYWSIGHRREDAFLEIDLDDTVTSKKTLDMIGKWELTSYGSWFGTLNVQRSMDKELDPDLKKWETIRTYRSPAKNARNVAATGTEEKQCWLQMTFVKSGSGELDPHAVLELGDNRRYGVVRITAVTDARHATAVVVKDLGGIVQTKIWAEGAFSKWQGYPQAVCLHDQRIVYGGTKRHPMSVWGSVTDDFENFRQTALDDASFFFTLAGSESDRIQWMLSQGSIVIGTAGSEWTLGPTDDATGLSPTNVRAKYQSSFGSKLLQARVVNEVVLFTQRQGRKVRALTYSYEKDGWVAPDLTILAEHIGKGEFVETAFQQQPDSIFWAITGEGELVGMTYERDQQIAGWHRHTTGQGWLLPADGNEANRIAVRDGFESVAAIYGNEGSDEVWFLVRRTVAGGEVRYIERLRPDFRNVFENEDTANWWYLDCAASTRDDLATFTSVANAGHLEHRRVGILNDGAPQADTYVRDGAVTIAPEANNVLVGLPYQSVLRPMPLDMPLQDGSSQGRKARVHKIFARFHKSLGGEYSADGEEWNAIFTRDFADAMDEGPPVFTGEKEVYMDGGFTRKPEIVIRQWQALPLCVLALIARWDAYGD